MQYPSKSSEYETHRLKWPDWLPRVCPQCQAKVKFKYADNGKKIHTLYGIVYQIVCFYSCTDEKCSLYQQPFNPNPRFDYSERYYGADVFREISEEFLLYKSSINSIYLKLKEKFNVSISERTVARICDDILNLKAYSIDQNTKAMLQGNSMVLLGLDGQDPGKNGKALWIFMDVLRNRVLYTWIVDSINYQRLHEVIEEITAEYGIKLMGFVSDKQNTIVKCCKTYYPDIPHQFCQYHFLRNTWNHLETLDSNLFLSLKKVLNSLYIHKANSTAKIHFEGIGKRSVREMFQPVEKDFQTMLKIRNKTFKQLRGFWLYVQLKEYTENMREQAKKMDNSLRIIKIFNRTWKAILEELDKYSSIFRQISVIQPLFVEVFHILNDSQAEWLEQQVMLDEIYDKIWKEAKTQGLRKNLSDLRSFLPRKSTKSFEVLGEWCRLWESYRPGLFQYRFFHEPIKTNNGCEQGFGKQKQAIYRRSAKKEVGYLVETRGEAYLRITHCTPEELREDIIQEYSKVLIQTLREKQQQKITERTKFWRTADFQYIGYQELLEKCYP